MNRKSVNGRGVKRLKDMYRKKFRIPENIEYYTKEDYKKAEKKYIKICLMTGNCGQ